LEALASTTIPYLDDNARRKDGEMLASDTASIHNEGSWVRLNKQVSKEKNTMVQLTETAVSKVKEILDTQEPRPSGLRIAVVGGGCSGFSYSMAFENTPNLLDKTYSFDGLKVFIDQASMLYLDGAEVDYVETLEGSGFKFNNPNVKNTCGCGSSFSV
jgi:iron-sulfur cluster assembly protein